MSRQAGLPGGGAQLPPWPGLGCPRWQGWHARQPRQELGAMSNVSYCCSRVFPFIPVLLPIKVKFLSNGKPSPPKALSPLSHPQVFWAVPSLIFNLFAANGTALGPVPPLQLPRSRAGTWHGWAPLPSSSTLIPFPAPPHGSPNPHPRSLVSWGRLPASLGHAGAPCTASLTPTLQPAPSE